jgi:hypothetical protein
MGSMKQIILFVFLQTLSVFCSGQDYTGAIGIQLRILTDQREYVYESQNVDGRLNDLDERFEYLIPINSIKAKGDSSDLNFIDRWLEGNNIVINASLPVDKSPDLDLSYFKGNKVIKLAGEIKLDSRVFKDDIEFNGILTNGGQGLIFNFNVFLNERELSLMQVGTEKILEIEITAKGDKISGLTLIK